jgi:4-amino-4-deoxy-L-arabinose transferase-like glycosyltransferase
MDHDTAWATLSAPAEVEGRSSPVLVPAPSAGSDLSRAAAARAVGGILFLGLVLRLALWAWVGNAPIHIADEREYNAIAVNLAERGEFATLPGRLTSIRPPLYPAMVAAVYKVAGLENFRAVRLIQVAISLLTVVLVYDLGAGLYSRRVGVWAAGLYSVYPSMVAYDRLLLTEVLFTALLCGTCAALVRAYRRDSIAWLIVAGVVLGLAALARSVLWPFPILLGAYLLLTWRSSAGRRMLAAAAVVVAAYATMAPWAVRNTRLQQTFTVVDVMGGRNLMMGNYEYTPMFRAWDAISEQGARGWDRVLAASDPGFYRLTQGQKDKVAMRAAVAYVKAHPWQTTQRDVIKFFNFWGLERELIAGASRGYFGAVSAPALVLLTLVIFGSYVAAVVSAILGAVLHPPTDWRLHVLLLLIAGYLCAMHTVSFGHSRYHLPLIPLMLVYSAQAVVEVGTLSLRRSSWRTGLAFALIGVLAVGWLWGILAVDLDQFLAAIRPVG